MPLSSGDIKRLESAGFTREKFVRVNKDGCTQLRNNRGYCIFYQTEKHRCSVYRFRPLGCRVYPVIYSVEEGVIVDDLCPLAGTVSKEEVKSKSEKLFRLLQRIDDEAEELNARV
jgi:Fe-S-cluster containining protein